MSSAETAFVAYGRLVNMVGCRVTVEFRKQLAEQTPEEVGARIANDPADLATVFHEYKCWGYRNRSGQSDTTLTSSRNFGTTKRCPLALRCLWIGDPDLRSPALAPEAAALLEHEQFCGAC